QQVIKASEANKQQRINEAEGQAAAILAVASATAEGIRKVAEAIGVPGGFEAGQLRAAGAEGGRVGGGAETGDTRPGAAGPRARGAGAPARRGRDARPRPAGDPSPRGDRGIGRAAAN